MTEQEDKELVKKAKKDAEAFGKLYDKYYSRIFGYILKRVANLDLAQDITSEIFLKALKNIGGFRWKNVPFSAWLYRISNNEISNYFRKNKYNISLDKVKEPLGASNLEAEYMEAQDKLERHRDFLKIQEKIAVLPVKYQEVLALRFFEGKKIKEIADILGKREGTIKSLLHRGLEQLKDFLETL